MNLYLSLSLENIESSQFRSIKKTKIAKSIGQISFQFEKLANNILIKEAFV
jgi:hypothetical protein